LLEAKYTATLKTHLKRHLYCLKLNVAYAKGVPDCYYSGALRDLWSEHKKFDTLPPKIDLTKTTVTSALQQLWLEERHNEGRNVGMIVFSKKGHLFLPGLEWQRPIPRDEFIARSKSYKELAAEIISLLGALKDQPLP